MAAPGGDRDRTSPPRTATQAASSFLGVAATVTGDAVEKEFGDNHDIYVFADRLIQPVIVVRTQDTGAMKFAYITLSTTAGGANTVTATTPTP